MFHRKRVDFAFACLQETKWRGSKSQNFGEGYKLIYTGSRNGRNVITVVASQEHLDNIVQGKRINDSIIQVQVQSEIVNFVSVYGPQVGCRDIENFGPN